jgi:hypothetical protein
MFGIFWNKVNHFLGCLTMFDLSSWNDLAQDRDRNLFLELEDVGCEVAWLVTWSVFSTGNDGMIQ